MFGRLKEILSYQDMINSLVHRELRGKYKGSLLGFLWTFISPLCQIIVYIIVFSIIVRSGLDHFYVYIISGMIPWFFFDGSLRLATGSIRYQGNLVKKIYFPHEVLPISMITASFVNMLLCFIIVFAVILFSGFGVNIKALLFLPFVWIAEYIFTLGLSLIISAATVYFKDLEYITSVLLMVWIYLTPILYSLESIPEKLQIIFKLNPMTYFIECYHSILYWKDVPTFTIMGRSLWMAVLTLIIGEIAFVKMDENFAEEM